jgi:predicted outer membrane repeat protein
MHHLSTHASQFRAVLAGTILLLAAGLAPAQVYVDINVVGGANDGSSWANAYTSIQAAIDDTRSVTEQIWVAGATYNETIVLQSGRKVYGGFLSGDTSLEDRNPSEPGPGPGLAGLPPPPSRETIITAAGLTSPSHVIMMENVVNTLIDNFTITGGNANGGTLPGDSGGGIYMSGVNDTNILGTLRIRNNIAAADGGGVFMSGSSPMMTNMLLDKNQAGDDGGGIYCTAGSAPDLGGISFMINEALDQGGGLYCSNNSPAEIEVCSFLGNAARAGGGVACNSNSPITLAQCEVNNNSATLGGGLYCTGQSSSSITSTSLLFNTADYGGGVFCDGNSNAQFIGCQISGNTALMAGGGLMAGAASPVATNCRIENNICNFDGGGVRLTSGSQAQFINTEILDHLNSAGSGDKRGGGVSLYDAAPTFEDCYIAGNFAVYGAGIDCIGSTPTLTNCDVFSNREGGGIWSDAGSLVTINGGTIRNNTGTSVGCGLYARDTRVVMNGCAIVGNEGAPNYAGGLFGLRAVYEVTDCDLNSNMADELGGGATLSNTTGFFENCRIVGNEANGGGAGIHLRNQSTITFTGCDFVFNQAGASGGAMQSIQQSSAILHECRIAGNGAGTGGGAIASEDGALSLRNCLAIGNMNSSGGGGAINASGGSLSMINCTVDRNRALQFGSAVFLLGIGTYNLTNCIFSHGSGIGGVYVEGGVPTTPPNLRNNVFFQNGTDYVEEGASLNLIGGTAINAYASGSTVEGNVDGNPNYVQNSIERVEGMINGVPSYDAVTDRTTFGSNDAEFTPGELTGRLIRVANDQNVMLIADNTTTQILLVGNQTGNVSNNQFYLITDHHIPLISSAVDRGTNTGAPATDLDGNARPVDVPELGTNGPGMGHDAGVYEQADTAVPGAVFVDRTADKGGDGRSWATAHGRIQDAIDNPLSEIRPIWIAQGIYTESLVMRSGRKLYGGFQRGETSFDQRDADFFRVTIGPTTLIMKNEEQADPQLTSTFALRAVTMTTVTQTLLDGLTLSGGQAFGGGAEDPFPFRGGGILMVGCDLTNVVNDCRILDNRCNDLGGGVFVYESSGVFTDCVIGYNSAGQGAGMMTIDASPTLSGCEFVGHNNSGALWIGTGSQVSPENCSFIGNSASGPGSALQIDTMTPITFTDCLFAGNRSQGRGTVNCEEDTMPTFINCAFLRNRQSNDTGGSVLYSDEDAHVTMINCTADGNLQQSTSAGAIEAIGRVSAVNCIFSNTSGKAIREQNENGEIDLDHCLFYANSDGDYYDDDTDQTYIGGAQIDAGTSGSMVVGNLTGDPRLAMHEEPAYFGAWTHEVQIVQEGLPGVTVMKDANASWVPDSLIGRAVIPFDQPTEEIRAFLAIGNTETEISILNGFEGGLVGAPYRILGPEIEATSAAIDRGMSNVAIPATDYLGAPRLVDVPGYRTEGPGEGYDIGAVESQTATATGTPPDVIFVDLNATGAEDGASWDDAYTTIGQALADAAVATKPIWVAKGVYPHGIELVNGARIYGGFRSGDVSMEARDPELNETAIGRGTNERRDQALDEPRLTLIEIPEFAHLVTADGVQNTLLDGFIVRGNTAAGSGNDGRGAGLFYRNANATNAIRNCVVEDCRAFVDGGAMYAFNSSPEIGDCLFLSNSADNLGGALALVNGSSPMMNRCEIGYNQSFNQGGGIYCTVNAAPTLIDCDLTRNNANDAGGAIFCSVNSNPTLERCRLISNSASRGGAAFCSTSSPEIVNTLFTGNEASDGGGLYLEQFSSPNVTNCTFADNYAGGAGSSVYTFDSAAPTLANCIFAHGHGSPAIHEADADTEPTVTNCLFFGNQSYDYFENPSNAELTGGAAIDAGVDGASGNVSGDPRFPHTDLGALSGMLTDETDSNEFARIAVIHDGNANYTPGALAGRWMSRGADSVYLPQFLILDNQEQTITVSIHAPYPSFTGERYTILDYGTPLESAAIDRGTDSGAPADDYPGNPRPVDVAGLGFDGPGAGFDIGAYEQQSTMVPGGVPDVIYVDTDAGGAEDGSTWTDAYTSIQDAIDDPDSATKAIWVARGEYFETLTMASGRQIYGGLRAGDLSLSGRDPWTDRTVIDAEQAATPRHVVTMNSVVNTRLDGFTLQNGGASGTGGNDGRGGGIIMSNVNATNSVRNCLMFNNFARTEGGGAAIRVNSSPLFVDCIFRQCRADVSRGGGVSVADFSSPRFERCSFFECQGAQNGGGVSCADSSSVELVDCSFSNCGASNGGGASVSADSELTMIRCTLILCNANGGGGVYCAAAAADLRDCVFSQCNASNGGGAAFDNGSGSVVNSVFDNNFASNGGAIYCSGAGAAPLIVNCTTARSGGSAGGGLFTVNGAQPIVRNCIFADHGSIAIHESDQTSDPEVTHCLFDSNSGGDYRDFDTLQTYTGANDINALVAGSIVEDNFSGDPRFRLDQDLLTRIGRTIGSSEFDETRFRTTFSVEEGTLAPGSLAGRLLEVSGAFSRAFVVDNTADSITVQTASGVSSGRNIDVVDYDLVTSSSATDRGDALDAPGFDIDGRPRPIDLAGVGYDGLHKGFDIGAYEYVGDGTGRVRIYTIPASGEWLLWDPSGTGYGDSGNADRENITAGRVRVEWQPLAGYTTPPAQEKTLIQGGGIDFIGVYTPVGGESGPQLAARILSYLLGFENDPTGLDVNADGTVDAADLVDATNP